MFGGKNRRFVFSKFVKTTDIYLQITTFGLFHQNLKNGCCDILIAGSNTNKTTGKSSDTNHLHR